jgi:hypothetical protein
MHEPNYFGWNERTGARLKTCNMCRRKRLDREQAYRERVELQNQRLSAMAAYRAQAAQEFVDSGVLSEVLPAPEITPEPVLWDAAAEVNMYSESEDEYFESNYWEAGGYGPRREHRIINIPGTSEEDRYLAVHPDSSSAAAAGPYSYYFTAEPDPEPAPDFGTESP